MFFFQIMIPSLKSSVDKFSRLQKTWKINKKF